MQPDIIAWIVAIVAGSIVAKVAGLILRKRDIGTVLGPLVGVIGAVILWRALAAIGVVEPTDAVAAGLAGAGGAAVLYGVVAAFKARTART